MSKTRLTIDEELKQKIAKDLQINKSAWENINDNEIKKNINQIVSNIINGHYFGDHSKLLIELVYAGAELPLDEKSVAKIKKILFDNDSIRHYFLKQNLTTYIESGKLNNPVLKRLIDTCDKCPGIITAIEMGVNYDYNAIDNNKPSKTPVTDYAKLHAKNIIKILEEVAKDSNEKYENNIANLYNFINDNSMTEDNAQAFIESTLKETVELINSDAFKFKMSVTDIDNLTNAYHEWENYKNLLTIEKNIRKNENDEAKRKLLDEEKKRNKEKDDGESARINNTIKIQINAINTEIEPITFFYDTPTKKLKRKTKRAIKMLEKIDKSTEDKLAYLNSIHQPGENFHENVLIKNNNLKIQFNHLHDTYIKLFVHEITSAIDNDDDKKATQKYLNENAGVIKLCQPSDLAYLKSKAANKKSAEDAISFIKNCHTMRMEVSKSNDINKDQQSAFIKWLNDYDNHVIPLFIVKPEPDTDTAKRFISALITKHKDTASAAIPGCLDSEIASPASASNNDTNSNANRTINDAATAIHNDTTATAGNAISKMISKDNANQLIDKLKKLGNNTDAERAIDDLRSLMTYEEVDNNVFEIADIRAIPDIVKSLYDILDRFASDPNNPLNPNLHDDANIVSIVINDIENVIPGARKAIKEVKAEIAQRKHKQQKHSITDNNINGNTSIYTRLENNFKAAENNNDLSKDQQQMASQIALHFAYFEQHTNPSYFQGSKGKYNNDLAKVQETSAQPTTKTFDNTYKEASTVIVNEYLDAIHHVYYEILGKMKKHEQMKKDSAYDPKLFYSPDPKATPTSTTTAAAKTRSMKGEH